MPYEPTNWQTGDIVSSERMNKIEQAVKDTNDDFFSATVDTSDSNMINESFNDFLAPIAAGKTIYSANQYYSGGESVDYRLIQCIRDKGPATVSGRYVAEALYYSYVADTETEKMHFVDNS